MRFKKVEFDYYPTNVELQRKHFDLFIKKYNPTTESRLYDNIYLEEPERPSWMDHGRVFKITKEKYILVTHPYKWDEELIRKWGTERGFENIVIDESSSFYFPNRTALIILEFNGVIRKKVYGRRNYDRFIPMGNKTLKRSEK